MNSNEQGIPKGNIVGIVGVNNRKGVTPQYETYFLKQKSINESNQGEM